MQESLIYHKMKGTYSGVTDLISSSLALLDKIDAIRLQRSHEETQVAASGGPLLMMVITDEINNYPDMVLNIPESE